MCKRIHLFRIIPAIILLLAGSILPAPSRIAADAGSPPVVTTGNATSITATSAVFRGTLASLGSGNSTSISFQWGTNSGNYTHETSPVSIGFTGNVSASISTLSANTTYYFRAKVVGDGVGYGVERSFATLATAALAFGHLNYPQGIAVDAGGDVYVADYGNHRIQKFTASGVFVTGWGTQGSGDGQFIYPTGIAVDAVGNVYVADTYNHRVQKFTSSGSFITKWGVQGQADGEFTTPRSVAVDSTDNIYVADNGNSRVQKFTSFGVFIAKWGSYGFGDGQFNVPTSIAVRDGHVYVADPYNHRIEKFTGSGDFIIKWGNYGPGDNQFNVPFGVAVDPSGNVFVADSNNNRIQMFTGDGAFINKWGSAGSGDGQFTTPFGVAVGTSDNVYVADSGNNRIQILVTALPPAVTTGNATDIAATSVRLNGTLDSWGTSSFVYTSFEWSNVSGNYTNENAPSILESGAAGNFSANITGLSANTTYYFKAKASGDGTSYGTEKSFTTLASAVIPGDANGDGVVNALDITKIERIIVGLDAPAPWADPNADGNINALDVTKVERIIAGL